MSLLRSAKPVKGFGKPRRWIQLIFEDDRETFTGYNGKDEVLHQLAAALLQNTDIAIALILDGSANIADVSSADILREYRRDDLGTGEQTLVIVGKPRSD